MPQDSYTTWEFPIFKALKIFAFCFLTGLIIGNIQRHYALDIALLTAVWNFHLAQPIMFGLDAATMVGIYFILKFSLKRQKSKQSQKRKAFLDRYIEGGEKSE